MRTHCKWKRLYYFLRYTQIVALITSAVAGATRDIKNPWAGIAWIVDLSRDNSAWFIPVASAWVIIAQTCCRIVGPPKIWKTVQGVLNQVHSQLFHGLEGDPLDNHRITLFKKVRCKWIVLPFRCWFWPWGKGRSPWSGWLVPIARSHHMTQRSNAVFAVPDNPDLVEGVAGQAWRRGKGLIIDMLPDLNENPVGLQLAAYAKRSYVSEDWVRERQERHLGLACFYCGILIEVAGEPWGVVVIDSHKGNLNKKRTQLFSEQLAFYLGRLLEGM